MSKSNILLHRIWINLQIKIRWQFNNNSLSIHFFHCYLFVVRIWTYKKSFNCRYQFQSIREIIRIKFNFICMNLICFHIFSAFLVWTTAFIYSLFEVTHNFEMANRLYMVFMQFRSHFVTFNLALHISITNISFILLTKFGVSDVVLLLPSVVTSECWQSASTYGWRRM